MQREALQFLLWSSIHKASHRSLELIMHCFYSEFVVYVMILRGRNLDDTRKSQNFFRRCLCPRHLIAAVLFRWYISRHYCVDQCLPLPFSLTSVSLRAFSNSLSMRRTRFSFGGSRRINFCFSSSLGFSANVSSSISSMGRGRGGSGACFSSSEVGLPGGGRRLSPGSRYSSSKVGWSKFASSSPCSRSRYPSPVYKTKCRVNENYYLELPKWKIFL